MAQHPWGHTIEIFSIESLTNGHSCDEHATCGSVIQEGRVSFDLVTCMKSNASPIVSDRCRWDLWVPIRCTNPCAFTNLFTMLY